MTSREVLWRAQAAGAVIKSARRLLANTPAQRLPLTSRIYAKVFRFGSAGDEVTSVFRGVRLTCPTRDITIVPGLVGGFYEKIELDVFERLAASSETIVDVGANIGLYSCIAALRSPASCEIIAFEPVPENLSYLRRNLADNGQASRVTIEERAVGESAGPMRMHLDGGSIGTHSLSAGNVRNSTTSITVPMVSLDDYVKRKLRYRPVDLLKVDVEGYEGAVLHGARKTLREGRPTLLIEFVPAHLLNCGHGPAEFLDVIFQGYDTVYLVDEPRATFRPCSQHDLLDYSGRGYKHANLIATSQSDRPAHHQLIESIRAGLP